MSKFSRVKNIFTGILMILCALVLILVPQVGYAFILIILAISMLVYGIKNIVYFVSMARHMVGGLAVLYRGLIGLDLALFTLSLTRIPNAYIMLYLIAIHLFSGAISIMRMVEAIKNGSRAWKGKLIDGLVNIAVAVLCAVFIQSQNVAVYIYAGGVIYSAIIRIKNALKRTAIVYIQ